MDENEETKLKKGKGEEHHLTFTKEPGTESGRYLLTGSSQLKVQLLLFLVMKFTVSWKSLTVFTPWKLSLLMQIQVAKEALLRSLRINLSGNCTLLIFHSIRMSFLSGLSDLDGSTKSPTAFTGPLGKLCETDHHDLPQVKFTQLSGPLDHMKFDETTLDDLSSDQRLLLEYVLGISKGEVNPRFAAWNLGHWTMQDGWLWQLDWCVCGPEVPTTHLNYSTCCEVYCASLCSLAGLRLKETANFTTSSSTFSTWSRGWNSRLKKSRALLSKTSNITLLHCCLKMCCTLSSKNCSQENSFSQMWATSQVETEEDHSH